VKSSTVMCLFGKDNLISCTPCQLCKQRTSRVVCQVIFAVDCVCTCVPSSRQCLCLVAQGYVAKDPASFNFRGPVDEPSAFVVRSKMVSVTKSVGRNVSSQEIRQLHAACAFISDDAVLSASPFNINGMLNGSKHPGVACVEVLLEYQQQSLGGSLLLLLIMSRPAHPPPHTHTHVGS
jgi:hypothetical protein